MVVLVILFVVVFSVVLCCFGVMFVYLLMDVNVVVRIKDMKVCIINFFCCLCNFI